MRIQPADSRLVSLALCCAALSAGGPAAAVEVKSFRAQSAQAFAGGTLDGVSLDGLGRLRAAPPIERVAAPDEPFVFAATRVGSRWILGTGNAGRVLEVSADGEMQTLFTTPEPEVFAVWADTDGTVFAGSSPNGKVYRYRDGKSEVYFDPQSTYIWSIVRSAAGELLVATGTEGKLFAVGRDGAGRLLFDAEDTHARSLAVLPSGETLLGTGGEGLIVVIDGRGKARTLYDAVPGEIVGFALAPDGVIYAGAIDTEAGWTDPAAAGRPEGGGPRAASAERSPGASEPPAGEGSGQASVTVTLGPDDEAGARLTSAGGLRSEIYRIAPGGLVDVLWTSKTDSVLALAWSDGRVWLGTGTEGKVWSLVDETPVLEKDFDERQVIAILAESGGSGAAMSFVTTNAAGVHRSGATKASAPAIYTSAALDAGSIARFGSFRWRGAGSDRGSDPGRASFSFRSGLSREPDRTWSEWTEWSAATDGVDLPLGGLAPGRYTQWRARFDGPVRSSVSIAAVELTYRAQNARPRIRRFVALDPGEVLVPANFNPSNQVFEPAHSDRQGFFSPVVPAAGGDEGRWKTLWKKGYRTLRWEAEDSNQDALRYRLDFRPEGGPAEEPWLEMADELTDGYYGFDETVLPDGLYRFRLRASDRDANAAGEGLEAERLSEAVLVDGTPPRSLGARRDGNRLRIEVGDVWNPLRAAEWSADAKAWAPAPAADGLVDGREEELVIVPPAGARLVLLRVTDAAFNVVTFDLSAEWRSAGAAR